MAQLAALLARCRMHIGADSGALHLAQVLGLKTVSIFRDYDGIGEWLPRGQATRSMVAPCRCVNQKVQPCADAQRPSAWRLSRLKTLSLSHGNWPLHNTCSKRNHLNLCR